MPLRIVNTAATFYSPSHRLRIPAQAIRKGRRSELRTAMCTPIGPHQFLASTWNDFAKANRDLFTGMSPEQILAARTNPVMSQRGTTEDSTRMGAAPLLEKAGIVVTARQPISPSPIHSVALARAACSAIPTTRR